MNSVFKSLFQPKAYREPIEEKDATIGSEALERIFRVSMFERMLNVVDDLSMRRLRDIFSGAESGRLGDLIDTYIKIENSDARLKGMIKNRRMAASRASQVVIPADEDNQLAVDAAELVSENIRTLPWNQFQRDLIDGRLYGVAMWEKVWRKRKDGALVIGSLHHVDHTRIEQYMLHPGSERFGELCLRTGKYGSDKLFLDEVPDYKLIVAANSDREGMFDLAGVMRPVARWYVLKTFAVKSWAQFAETYGFPVPTITVAKKEFNDNKKQIKTLLESVGVNRYGIFFDSMDYELHDPPNSSSIEVFEKFINLANTEEAIAILGQNLTTEVQGGSRAASETHMKVLGDIVDDDVEWSEEIIQDQIVNEITRVNFPNLPTELYPTYRAITKKNINLRELGAGLREMSRLVEIPKKWIYEESQIPQPAEDEAVIGGYSDGVLDKMINER
ncbi:MAG: DUF935 domain-containing protein [Actinobacteria bacterium]|nr:DUF935 domain-containing protein [Actinomycetota bacterium]